jgi:hypothetical protein
MECIICLTDISINDFYKLSCCNNDVHIKCINKWIQSNINNKDILKCFICNQNNDIIEDIVLWNSQKFFNNDKYINIHTINDNENNINRPIINNLSNNLYKKKILKIISIISITTSSLIIILLLNNTLY